MLFTENRSQFFRPLTGKYRQQVVECLQAFYALLYSRMANYSQQHDREQVLQVFQEAITRAPVLDDDEDNYQPPVKNDREQANWVLNQLLEYGWIDILRDDASMRSVYAFSKFGRLFTQPMVETQEGHYRTRHRNTRNTRNALASFVEKGDAYDLLDAYEFSERIISDFSDVIAELDEKKRQLVQEIEAQQLVQRASDEFFDFMEKRFIPDLAVRLSADSVEKYRDDIQQLLDRIRRKKTEFKANAERDLRKLAPELIDALGASVLMKILDGIEYRMQSASGVMLPALRSALAGFTRRADIIIRQLSYTGSHQNRLLGICADLKKLNLAQQELKLKAAGDAMAVVNFRLADTDSLRLLQGRQAIKVNDRVETNTVIDKASRREFFINQALETAFAVNNQEMRDYIVEALGKGHRVHSQNLPVRNARELLRQAHAIEIAARDSASSEFIFRVEPTGQRSVTEYFAELDEFTIELVERN
ncbi:MAG: hypothetical protein ACI8P9_000447 [Parasphingorhabdus sp.]|jgi:hypothetical protein